MHKRIMFHSMAYSAAVEKYISQKFEKIYKFFKREPKQVSIDVMIEPHREKGCYKAQFKINSTSYHIAIQVKGFDVYAMIDQAMTRTIKEITKRKERLGYNLHAVCGA